MKNLDQQILDDIIEGKLAPGKKLTIKFLSENYQIGPTPIREALSRLEKTQLIQKEENRGFFVPSLTEDELIDLQKTFCDIECMALKKAIKNKNSSWESEIVGALYQLSKIETKDKVCYMQWLPLNEAFHLALVKGCQSKELIRIRHQLYIKLKRYTYLAFQLKKEELKINHKEHEQIAKASLNGEVEKACDLLSYHILGALPDLVGFFREKGVFT